MIYDIFKIFFSSEILLYQGYFIQFNRLCFFDRMPAIQYNISFLLVHSNICCILQELKQPLIILEQILQLADLLSINYALKYFIRIILINSQYELNTWTLNSSLQLQLAVCQKISEIGWVIILLSFHLFYSLY